MTILAPTIPLPTQSTVFIYVSDSVGDDANDGLSQATPKKTLAAARNLFQSANGDRRLLLKRGDVFLNQSLGNMNKVGASPRAPMVIDAYGNGPRPVVATGQGPGIGFVGGGGAPLVFSNWAVANIDFYAHKRDPSNSAFIDDDVANSGVTILRGTDRFILENVSVRFFGNGFNIIDFDGAGNINGFVFRRCKVLDTWNRPAHGVGMYMQGHNTSQHDGVFFDECVFDHNGWNPNIPGGYEEGTIFEHNLYVQSSENLSHDKVYLRKCMFLRGASHGVQLRAGGRIEDCFFSHNALSILVGGGDTPVTGGVDGVVLRNVILHGTNIKGQSGDLVRGMGVDLENIRNAAVLDNIVAHVRDTGVNNRAYQVDADGNTVYSGNVEHKWAQSPPAADDQTNKGGISSGPFVDDSRTIASFDAQAWAGSEDNFFAQVRASHPKYSIDAILDYFREGFTPIT